MKGIFIFCLFIITAISNAQTVQNENAWLADQISSKSFSLLGNINKNKKVTLNWTIAENESINNFEIERSTNGRDFKTIAVFLTSEKNGIENYLFYETVKTGKVMYRLKIITKQNCIAYSSVIKPGNKIIKQ